MKHMIYASATYKASAFNCPLCHAYSNQVWSITYKVVSHPMGINGLDICTCSHCHEYSVWFNENMIFPFNSIAPHAHADLPVEIKVDYEEARTIFSISPRGACALLRLCVEKLCCHLLGRNVSINTGIGELVKNGLNQQVQKSMDTIRVLGNEAVHAGQIDINDDPNVAIKLFGLINFICEDQITRPREIDKLFNSLPEEKLKGIENRDK
ncbi:MAG: DUF4145 domain-containing protein [Verrucomicrobia bacterium]|nr:DUF4145 domain-containing protein [Verrucomicrobiota bacterium]